MRNPPFRTRIGDGDGKHYNRNVDGTKGLDSGGQKLELCRGNGVRLIVRFCDLEPTAKNARDANQRIIRWREKGDGL